MFFIPFFFSSQGHLQHTNSEILLLERYPVQLVKKIAPLMFQTIHLGIIQGVR